MTVGGALPVGGQVPIVGDIVAQIIYSGTGMDMASNPCISGFPTASVIVYMDTDNLWTFCARLSIPW